MSKRQDYLFLRRGSRFWRVRLQAGGKSTEKSLGTTDRAQAEILAAPLVTAHKAAVLARRPRSFTRHNASLPAGLYASANADVVARLLAEDEDADHWADLKAVLGWLQGGGQVFASETELHYLDATGKEHHKMPNGGLAIFAAGPMAEALQADKPQRRSGNGDDAILETYLDEKGVSGPSRREAENTWAMFRQLTGHKPLAKCGWADGKTLVAYYQAKGLKSASIHKRLVRLNAAVAFAVKTGNKLAPVVNPFSAVVPDLGKDAKKKVSLTDADLQVCRENLDKLGAQDQLLFRFLCSTGARLGEAFQVRDEETIKGIRFCEVGTKNAASHRRIPFPDCLLPHLPLVITGPLLKGDPASAGKRLNEWLHDDCGIGTKDEQSGQYDKTAHSLRHRAVELLREAECPDNISRRLFGHTRDPHEQYGSAIVVLKKWVDRIDGI